MRDQTESFGELLRRHRVAAGLTQEALAERAGLSRRGIADLERGVRRAPYKHTLARLVDGLELDQTQRSELLSAGQRARSLLASRAARTAPAQRTQVEEPLTGFVGRRRELAEIQRHLAATRLLTLTGTGGVGKTLLALKAATQVMADYADGVSVVELAALMRADLVGHVVASSIGITESHTDSVSDAIVEELRSKSVLLVLDNCEHLIEACAEIAGTLIRACPRLRILATSREPLGVQGETTWAVPPLAMAAPDAPLEAQTGADAARLFVERVNAVRSDFILNERNTQVVLDICRTMAGIPLALELAAARLRVLEPEEVHARLGQALSLLAGSSRTAPPRQRTMRAALDWSYALLSENEQQLLADLSVFAGGWDLEAVEATCAVQPPAALQALDVMTSLVDKSLIMVERHDGHSRYRFLEPVRQYAHERLDARGDILAIRRRHALHYLQVAEDAALEVASHHLAARLDHLEHEHDNFRAALEWSTQHGDGDTGLRLAAALHWFWLVRGYASEGRAWLRRALAAQDTATPTARARALVATGSLAMFQHDHAAASVSLEAALNAWRDIGDARGVAVALLNLSQAELSIGNTRRAEELLRESLELFRALRDDISTASCLYRLGDLTATLGDLDQAQALTEESLELGHRVGDDYRIASALHVLGHFAYMRGDLHTAAVQLRESLVLSKALVDRRGIAVCMESVALLAAVRGHPERAARLFGAAGRLRAATLAGRRVWIETTYIRGVDATRTAIGDSAYAAAAAAGGALTLSAAVAEALAALEPQSTTVRGRATRDGDALSRQDAQEARRQLSPREQDVTRLIARECTNRQIGVQLVIAEPTVERHIANIFSTLGVHSRGQVAAWTVEHL